MNIIRIMCLTLSIILMVFGLWLMHKANNVFIFRKKINYMCKDWSLLHVSDDDYESAYDWCYSTLPTFNKMVYSFKPLKLKYWLAEDVIKKIKNNEN